MRNIEAPIWPQLSWLRYKLSFSLSRLPCGFVKTTSASHSVNSDFADHWTGIIVIMPLRRCDDWLGDASWDYGDYTFFGDKELLNKVRHCLLED